MNTTRILNVDILPLTQKDLLTQLQKGVLVTPNVDHLVKLQKDKAFYEVYQQAEWVVCDSKILYLLSKLLKHPLPEAIPGSSFFTAFYLHHKDNPNCKIFLLGAKEGVAQKAMKRINQRVGREIIVGAHSPSFGFEKKEDECKELIDIVNKSGANVLLVGVGAPKQEEFMSLLLPHIKRGIMLGVGAAFNFTSGGVGQVKRAPQWMRKLRLEWFYRAFEEPKKNIPRYWGFVKILPRLVSQEMRKRK